MSGKQDDTLAMIQGEVRALVAGRLAAQAAHWNEGRGSAADALPQLAAMGLLGIVASEAQGGAGLDAAAFATVIEELAVADAGLAALVAMHNVATVAAKVPALAAALAGAAAGAPVLAALLAGGSGQVDDRAPAFALEGGKVRGVVPQTVGAGAAARAVAMARDSGGAARWVVFDLGDAAVQRDALDGGPLLGLRSAGSTTVVVAGAPALAHAPADFAALVRALKRLAMAAIAVGVGRAALSAGVRYTLERQQFGKAIATFQPIGFQTADAAVAVEAAHLLVQRAAVSLRFDAGPHDALGAAGDAVDRAVVCALDAARQSSDRALQWHGGYGYTTDFIVERAYRDAFALPLLGGSAIAAKARVGRRLAAGADA